MAEEHSYMALEDYRSHEMRCERAKQEGHIEEMLKDLRYNAIV